MSAYICNKETFVYLVSAAMSHRFNYSGSSFRWRWKDATKPSQRADGELRCDDFEKAAEAANMLHLENLRSVSYRYPGDKSSATLPGPIGGVLIEAKDFRIFAPVPEPVQVLKTIQCLRYQSCEHPGWEESEAAEFLRSLELSAISRLPGYEEASWGAPVARNVNRKK